ncbi:response regulator [Maribacter algarum]|uniref:Response regulator n=1 Tax=Maribacter algarum (ex Zhang et al. 2020) TaxID=2578118 RepID=A0A5S3PRV7_9FLAO|nr:response regulator [Maribacter algarum]TMM56643.1 response regulator [Maribacter algarum]
MPDLKNCKKYSQIFLVDDFDMSNLFHSAIFKKLQIGENINIFINPENALKDIRLKLDKATKILILLDVNMPEMNGFEFLDIMVREHFPCKIDVIIATSSISEVDRAKALEYPEFVKGFVTKPVKIDDLKVILEPLNKAI